MVGIMHMIFFLVGSFWGRVGTLSIRLESKVHFGMKALFFTQTQSSSIVGHWSAVEANPLLHVGRNGCRLSFTLQPAVVTPSTPQVLPAETSGQG